MSKTTVQRIYAGTYRLTATKRAEFRPQHRGLAPRDVPKYFCSGCSHEVVLDPCVICAARAARPSAS
jgi:hypothetical protein